MQYKWLKKTGEDKLLIFFTGWGMDADSVQLDLGEMDLLVVYDYRSEVIENSVLEEIAKYSSKTCIAWSLGLVAAATKLKEIKADFSIAINGSLFPANDNLGIPEATYQGTYDNLSERSLNKFMRRVFVSKDEFNVFIENRDFRDISVLKEELLFVRQLASKLSLEDRKLFDKVIVSKQDKIFPVANLICFWENALQLDTAHYPFYGYSSWEEIVALCKIKI